MSPGSAASPRAPDFVVPGWLPGWKVARLRTIIAPPGIAFLGWWSPLTFGVGDLARCYKVATHVPPVPGCRCGFYAWHEPAAALRSLDGSASVILDVELAGRVVVHEHGLVAARQRVRRVWVDAACHRDDAACRPAVAVTAHPARPRVLVSACPAHLPADGPAWDLVDLAASFGVPVGWSDACLPASARRDVAEADRPDPATGGVDAPRNGEPR